MSQKFLLKSITYEYKREFYTKPLVIREPSYDKIYALCALFRISNAELQKRYPKLIKLVESIEENYVLSNTSLFAQAMLKELNHNDEISIKQMSRDINLSVKTIKRLLRGTVKNTHRKVFMKIVNFYLAKTVCDNKN